MQETTKQTPANIVIFSGGIDSTVLLWKVMEEAAPWEKTIALSFDYRQRHRMELEHALGITDKLEGVRHFLIELSYSHALNQKGAGSQSGSVEVPEGHYAEESMRDTVSPNRNMIMLSVAAAVAISYGQGSKVFYGAHAGDHTIYPDCRRTFVSALNTALREGNLWLPTRVIAPFIDTSKAWIVELGARLGAPLERTYSCYKGGEKHCGKCGTCVERREAFQLAGVPDPTEYEA